VKWSGGKRVRAQKKSRQIVTEMLVEDQWGQECIDNSEGTWGGGTFHCFAFDGDKVGTIDAECAGDIERSDMAVADKIVTEDGLELGLARAA
jgi:hypothetical protein